MEEMRGAAKESKKAGAAGRTAASGIRSKSPFDLQMFGRKNKSQPGSVKSIAELPIHVKHVLADFAKGIRDEGTRGKGYVATNLEEGTPVATRGAAVRSSRGEGALFNSKDVAHAKSIIRKGMGIRVSDAEAENLLGQMMHAEPWRARTLKDGRSFTMTNEDDRRAIMSPEEIKREDALMDDLMSTHQRVSAGAKSRQARELEQDIATGKQRPAVKEFMKKQRQEERRLKALQPKRPRGRPRKGGGGGGGQGGPGLFGAQSEGQLRGRLLKGRTPRQVLEDIIYGHPEDIANVTSGTGAIIEALRETVQDLRRKKRDSR
jgi:hypothetical protein